MFKKSISVIEFASSESDIHHIPKPSKLSIPLWYKKTPSKPEGLNVNTSTMKQCVPFLESLMAGYIAELWCDILVTKENNKSVLTWTTHNAPIREREVFPTLELPVPEGHSAQRFTWKSPYFIKTPPNHSVLITHPFNRYDLPFTTLSAIVDTHEIMYNGNIPFFLKKDFEGIIQKGTPVYQILPFVNNSWESKENTGLIKEGLINERKSFAVFSGWYKNNVWVKKDYS